MLPWLYLQVISTEDFTNPHGGAILGEKHMIYLLVISRLKQQWLEEHRKCCQRNLSDMRYVYFLADGIYSHLR
ncbi:MAG: hypothetical protein ACTS73_09710 [Arsenophonus sp. NEOnobi-MAG3]